jgi:3-O-methylgallate 3,4-dioxygenase
MKMAKVVLGFGSSHGPTIATEPSAWDRMAERDKKDPRYDYATLLSKADPRLVNEIIPEKKAQRHAANQQGIATLQGIVEEAAPDVVIVVSNPHGVLPDDMMPAFGVFRGETLFDRAERRVETTDARMDAYRGPAPVQTTRPAREARQYRAMPELAEHLIDELIDDGFDVASALELRKEHGLDEAFQVFYELYDPECKIPMVPFFLSRYLPSQATPRRCYALGGALRRAIDSWDSDTRVALMASGGLSHQIIDEELDRIVAEALIERNVDVLCSLDRERLNGAPGTPEILNWITVAGAMDPLGMTLVGYEPCYRSPAGTGHGVTFGYWRD